MTILLTLLSVGILAFGCTQKLKIIKKPDFADALRVENIESEICRLEKVIEDETDSYAKSKVLFHLALLYSHHKNPTPDYERALKKLEEYASINPAEANTDKVLYLRSLLHWIEKNKIAYEKLKHGKVRLQTRRIKTLERENEDLRNKNKTLLRENQGMKEVIEKLKYLDIRLEKKRQKF